MKVSWTFIRCVSEIALFVFGVAWFLGEILKGVARERMERRIADDRARKRARERD